jgi:hypothetical protein
MTTEGAVTLTLLIPIGVSAALLFLSFIVFCILLYVTPMVIGALDWILCRGKKTK